MGQCLGCFYEDHSIDDVLKPDYHCLPWCLGSAAAGHFFLRVQQLDIRCETKTKIYF
ncbi:hypothetical protein RchiOBHm_Chr6g0283081 [Rosa chinensis]|uniref:Uncharacterized protein n=1 Tax=Rosa chinensis TaxID=74649 RepID=A0A2P6PTX8_ROSCH|nr:hypothetical protein RchiOBHm_Chr6g0283081 [Rosa chinensis]